MSFILSSSIAVELVRAGNTKQADKLFKEALEAVDAANDEKWKALQLGVVALKLSEADRTQQRKNS